MAKKSKLRLSRLYSFSCVRPDVAENEFSMPLGGVGFSRIVYCNQPEMHSVKPVKYRSNYVSTTKYSILSFFPKALFEQFRRVANVYFLFAAALSLTPLAPVAASSLIAPLVFVIGVSMVKEAIEDWRRFLQDSEVNSRKVNVHVGSGTFMPREWNKLRVGDVVKVEKDSFFPSDLLILSSSYPDGICYVETMNLDGETNLKLKKCLERTVELDEDREFEKFQGIVKCEDPNPELYTFVGNLEYVGEILSIGPQQILLRDSKLRNTQFIYGVVIFSGHDTKVMQNATTPPSKRSTIERKMDYIIYLLFTVLLLIASVGSIVFGIRTDIDMPNWWYMQPNNTTVFYDPKNAAKAAFLHFVTALILYGYLIPISLYVSIEVVKVLQTTFINQDRQMYHEETDKPANARTSNLNEELGQVDTILSDKTGTLTCNMMEFLKCSIAGTSYGHGITEVEKATAKRLGRDIAEYKSEFPENDDYMNGGDDIEMTASPHVKGFNFKDNRLMNGKWICEPHPDVILMFFRILAVCQTALPDENEDTGEISYEAESPDEGAFVIAAREFGFEFCRRTQTSVLLRELDPTTGKKFQREYKILNLLEFNSTRKRMSVILRDEDGQIFLFCKGADSVIFERLGKQGRVYEATTKDHLAKYGDAGLRTLALAYRKLDESEYANWNAIFLKAKTTVGADRDAMLDSASELIERDLFFVGATAVEDKLQKGVPECIDRLAQAGLKIWVLTGDKLETAINIGFACSLLRQGMKQIMISLDMPGIKLAEDYGGKETLAKASRESISQQIVNGQQEVNVDSSEETVFALVIDGKALSYALEDSIKDKFLQLAISCASVICCRVSPKQKALVTKLVREGTGRTTLAIGDGANDVGMIQEADIGVGISGVEGMQAVMASDFAIAQFRFLERLLIVHGHWCYKRIATMICYFFYKNITFGLTLFYYEANTSFSGQSAYNDWFMSLFNVIFSSLPVLALGVFEQDVSAHVCLQFPALYQQGPRNMFFNWPRILGWISNGLYGSLVIFIFSAYSLQHQAFRDNGKLAGLEILGVTMYTCAIWTVNCQIALAISHFTWIQHVLIWGSILVWYAFLVVYGFIDPILSTTAYRVFLEAAALAPIYWLIVLIIIVTCLLPYFFRISVQRMFDPMDHHIIQEIRYLEKDTRDPEMWKREQGKAVRRTDIGSTARVEARVRQLKELLQEPL